jgi:hypothetical protein
MAGLVRRDAETKATVGADMRFAADRRRGAEEAATRRPYTDDGVIGFEMLRQGHRIGPGSVNWISPFGGIRKRSGSSSKTSPDGG